MWAKTKKEYLQALINYAKGSSELVDQYVFSTEGLEKFTGLEYLNLSVNWIETIDLHANQKLKSVKLDGNLIQRLVNLPDFVQELSVNANPLYTLNAPVFVQALSINKRIPYIYYGFALDQKIPLQRMKNKSSNQFLDYADFRQSVDVTNRNKLVYLTALDVIDILD